MVAAYHKRCPAPPKFSNKKRSQFKILQYYEEIRRSEGLIRDCVKEMMHIAKFNNHVAKPERGGLDWGEGTALFNKLAEMPDAIVDEGGPDRKNQRESQ